MGYTHIYKYICLCVSEPSRAFDDIIVSAIETHRLKPNYEHSALGNFDALITPQMLGIWTRLHRLLNLAITMLPIEMIDSIACTHPTNHLKKTCRIPNFIIIVIVVDVGSGAPAATDIILSIFLQHRKKQMFGRKKTSMISASHTRARMWSAIKP